MPRPLAPHKSGLHRQACLSLYRSLLRASSRIGTAPGSDNPTPETVRSLILFRFHKDRSLLSLSQVGNGLNAGHGFLALLQRCGEDESVALDQLHRILEKVKTKGEATSKYRAEIAARWKPPPKDRIPHLENLRRISDKANHVSKRARSTPASESSPSEQSKPRIFQHPRPLSEIKSGVRKVPNLILAQGVPILKYPGPTPVIINRILKEKIQWGIRKWEQHKELEGTIAIAGCEDDWDEILAKRAGIAAEEEIEGDDDVEQDSRGPKFSFIDSSNDRIIGTSSSKRLANPFSNQRISWTKHLKEVDRGLEIDVLERGKQYALLGNRLFTEVVVKERELKEQERKEAKHKRRMVRKQAGDSFGGAGNAKGQEEEPSSLASGFI